LLILVSFGQQGFKLKCTQLVLKELRRKQLKFASCLLLAGSHLFVSRLHVAGVLILILTASIRQHFLFDVVLRVSNVYGCLFGSLLFALVSTSGSFQVLLPVVQIVFELFVEDHLVGIAHVRIFISFWGLGVIGCDDA
jgi:hypothetical protein